MRRQRFACHVCWVVFTNRSGLCPMCHQPGTKNIGADGTGKPPRRCDCDHCRKQRKHKPADEGQASIELYSTSGRKVRGGPVPAPRPRAPQTTAAPT